ncbi:hypothetical protein ACFPOB_20155 [Bosea eneae]|uniref:Lipoprotein n=1 Tax=Bosea eneae TaxID=151454 RepID=A0ABW0IUV2_9HYPH
MSKWKIALILLIGAIYAVSLTACGESFGTYHFRLTIEADTPEGVRSGSGVMSVSYGRGPRWAAGIGGGNAYARLRGEAVFFDLGNGRNVVMLIAHGARAESGFEMRWLPVTALTGAVQGWGSTDALAALQSKGLRLEGKVELPPPLIPTLATFSEVNDPTTMRQLGPSEFPYYFGKGYTFKRATLEIVSSGIWPFSLLPLPWPRWLFGYPITRGIKDRLPALNVPDGPNTAFRSARLTFGGVGNGESAFRTNY